MGIFTNSFTTISNWYAEDAVNKPIISVLMYMVILSVNPNSQQAQDGLRNVMKDKIVPQQLEQELAKYVDLDELKQYVQPKQTVNYSY